MVVIEVRLHKFTTAVLIINWVVNPTSEHTVFIVETKIRLSRLNKSIHSFTIHLKFLRKIGRMQYKKFVSINEVR